MNKLMGLFLLGALCFGLTQSVEAAGATRGAKASTNVYGTQGIIGVSSGTAVLYSVVLGTGAAGDYAVLFDSASATGITATSFSSPFKMRIYFGSTTANTIVNFDPPLQFTNGIIVSLSTTTAPAAFVWERGRVVTGY